MANTTQAVLFDVDGTLLDTSEYIYQAYKHVLEAHGISLPWDAIRVHMGKPLLDIYRILAASHDAEALAEMHKEFQKEHVHLSKLYPNVPETLAKLREAGIKLAVVTTRYRANSYATLERAGIKDFFDAFVTGDDVLKLKPDPEPLNTALEALDAAAGDAFMVGDTIADIGAGKNAGTRTIAVSYGFHGDTIAQSEPDYIIERIEDMVPIVLGE